MVSPNVYGASLSKKKKKSRLGVASSLGLTGGLSAPLMAASRVLPVTLGWGV